ncbi:MAG TPA: DMT family transporter, partial [Bacillota bacterium]|nr:DMT family transporter [Bacillota bacterium]
MPDHSFTKGPLRMLFSSGCFAAMGYFAKLATAGLPGTEVAFIRFFVGVLAALILAASGRVSLRTSQKRLLITRGIFGGAAVLLYFLAIAGGSLTNSTVLNNTFPIFATILAAIFLHERLGVDAIFSMLIAWAGVLLLIHPDFHHLFWPDILGLLSGISGGFAIMAVR